MNINHPVSEQIPQLRTLWKEAFGDSENFLDNFYSTAFSPERCLCATIGCELAAMAYWFDCEDYAYIYAVATASKHRGKGICHALMEKLHSILTEAGYAGCIVVPGEESLRDFYQRMGYENFGGIHEFFCDAGAPLPLRQLDIDEFASLRRKYLPEGGVVQEGTNLNYLSCWAKFYEAPNALATVVGDDGIYTLLELLGNEETASGIFSTLGIPFGKVRIPGNTPYAMHRPLCRNKVPNYFGFCF